MFRRNEGAMTGSANTWISLNSHRCVKLEQVAILWQRKFFQQRMRGGTGGPNQSKTLDPGSVGEFDFGRRNCFDFGVRPDLYTPRSEFAGSIASELFA